MYKIKEKFCDIFIIIKHKEPSQGSTFPTCLFLEFLIDLTMVSEGREYPYEASVKVQLRSNLRNPVKTPPIQSLILENIRFWWTLKWWQMKEIILHKDPSMSCPDKPEDGVI